MEDEIWEEERNKSIYKILLGGGGEKGEGALTN